MCVCVCVGVTRSWSGNASLMTYTSTLQVVPVQADSESYSTCAPYFQLQKSPLRACFSQVDPKPFFDMCLTDVTKQRNYDTGMCSIIDAYISQCHRQGIELSMPDKCSKLHIM